LASVQLDSLDFTIFCALPIEDALWMDAAAALRQGQMHDDCTTRRLMSHSPEQQVRNRTLTPSLKTSYELARARHHHICSTRKFSIGLTNNCHCFSAFGPVEPGAENPGGGRGNPVDDDTDELAGG
jgi:hypothetical protein